MKKELANTKTRTPRIVRGRTATVGFRRATGGRIDDFAVARILCGQIKKVAGIEQGFGKKTRLEAVGYIDDKLIHFKFPGKVILREIGLHESVVKVGAIERAWKQGDLSGIEWTSDDAMEIWLEEIAAALPQ